MCSFLAFNPLIPSAAASALHIRSSLANNTQPHNVFGTGEPRTGWTEAPDTRGTFDILTSCVFTSFICCWSILCINVPAKNATQRSQFKRKALTALATLLAPEVTCFTAIGQYVSAAQSVRAFRAADGLSGGWTMRHAFFADMGGFVLQPRGWVAFPVNARQLLWLVEQRYVDMAAVLDAAAAIRDKNKANGFMRLVTALQITWFCVNIAGRLGEGLALTAIEVTTVAFIYYALGTMFFWRHKPADIETAEVLRTTATMDQILLAGGEAARGPYRQTPLDFVCPQQWVWLRYLEHFENAVAGRLLSRNVPIDHISSMTTPEIPLWIFRVCSLGVIGNFALFVPSWFGAFPSREELILWRIAIVGNVASLLGGQILTELVFNVCMWPSFKATWHFKRNGPELEDEEPLNQDRCEQARSKKQWRKPRKGERIETAPSSKRTIWDMIRNNSPSNHPDLTLPLKAILPMWFIAIIYLVSRAFIIVEDFIELRSLPLSAFKNVQWPGWFPHI